MLISALASSSLVCLVDDPKITRTFLEFLLQVQGGLPQGSLKTGLTAPCGSLMMSTNEQESDRCIKLLILLTISCTSSAVSAFVWYT